MVCNEEQEEIFFLSKEEMRIRDLAESRTFIMFLIGLVSSFKVFAIHLITFEAMFNVIITAAFTCLSYFGGVSREVIRCIEFITDVKYLIMTLFF